MSLVTETSAKLAARNSRIETFTVIQHRTDNCSFSPYTVGVCLSWNSHELYDDQTRLGEATGFEETGMKRLVTSFFFSRDEFYIFSCSIFSSWNIDVYLLFVLYILFLQFSFFSSRFLDIRYWWRFWKVYFRKKFWEEKIFENEKGNFSRFFVSMLIEISYFSYLFFTNFRRRKRNKFYDFSSNR